MATNGVPIKYAMNLFLNQRLNNPNVWNYGNSMDPGMIKCDNGEVFYTGNELMDQAIAAKRNGLYDKSIYYYLFLFDAQYKVFGKISIVSMRSYIKTKICANDFLDAFNTLSTMLADMQQAVNAGLKNYDEMTYMLIRQDYITLFNMAKDAIDNNDFSGVESFCANYAGSPLYRLPRSRSEIRDEFATIRQHIRNIYGE